MGDNQNTVFREKNLKKAQDPEQLNSYLKLTGYKAWFVIAAAALVIAAIFVWFLLAKITTVFSGAGTNTGGIMICYFSREDTEDLEPGALIEAEGTVCVVKNVDTELYTAQDIPNEVLYYLPESNWYTRVEADGAALEDGLYRVSFTHTSDASAYVLKDRR